MTLVWVGVTLVWVRVTLVRVKVTLVRVTLVRVRVTLVRVKGTFSERRNSRSWKYKRQKKKSYMVEGNIFFFPLRELILLEGESICLEGPVRIPVQCAQLQERSWRRGRHRCWAPSTKHGA